MAAREMTRRRPALWTAIGFAVGLVLGREVEAAPFFCSQVFFWLEWGLIALFMCLGGGLGAGFAPWLG